MRTFIITHPKFTGDLELAYDLEGVIFRIERRADLTEEQVAWIFGNIYRPADLIRLDLEHGFKFIEMPLDLSFDAFWKIWPGAKGNKDKALKPWGRMTNANKAKAIFSCAPYRKYLERNPGIAKKWPDGYLNQQYYNNDYDRL